MKPKIRKFTFAIPIFLDEMSENKTEFIKFLPIKSKYYKFLGVNKLPQTEYFTQPYEFIFEKLQNNKSVIN